MNRRDVIKNLFGSAFAIMLPWQLNSRNIIIPEKSIYRGFVAGYQYYEGEENESFMKNGDPLELKREPENPEDYRAIIVFWNNVKLGYIPRKHNLILKNMLDGGIGLSARIRKIYPDEETWKRIKLEVFMR